MLFLIASFHSVITLLPAFTPFALSSPSFAVQFRFTLFLLCSFLSNSKKSLCKEHTVMEFEGIHRKCLQALIETPFGKVNFFLTHLGLNDMGMNKRSEKRQFIQLICTINTDQCRHTVLLWKFMQSFPREIPQILVGDMNTYFDFEWPVDFLTKGFTPFMLSKHNPCSSVLNLEKERMGQQAHFDEVFTDVWEEVYPLISKEEREDGR